MIKFHKYQSVGNDFIIIDQKISLSPEEIKMLCHRNFGIGADGILIIDNNNISIFNSDGTNGEICLNGIRCVADYLFKTKSYPKTFSLTMSDKNIQCDISNQITTTFLSAQYLETKTINGLLGHIVMAPNPHFIVFEKVTMQWVRQNGPLIESHFPNGTNIEFVWDNNILVYERGCGITLGCGSGVAAVAQAMKYLNKLENKTVFHLPGGKLSVSVNNEYTTLTGIAQAVFSGEYKLNNYSKNHQNHYEKISSVFHRES